MGDGVYSTANLKHLIWGLSSYRGLWCLVPSKHVSCFIPHLSSPCQGNPFSSLWGGTESSLSHSNSAACSSAVRKPAISLADSTDLR